LTDIPVDLSLTKPKLSVLLNPIIVFVMSEFHLSVYFIYLTENTVMGIFESIFIF